MNLATFSTTVLLSLYRPLRVAAVGFVLLLHRSRNNDAMFVGGAKGEHRSWRERDGENRFSNSVADFVS